MVWTAEELMQYPYDPRQALQHFHKVDQTLFDLTEEIGEYALELMSEKTPFEALFRSIVYQQLSGQAATNILNRVLGIYGDSFPAPEQVENTPEDQLRACGLSWSKVRSVRDLANKTVLGLVPAGNDISSMNDRELIKAFTVVYGIGPWTVDMLMIFNLGRPDILPVSDLGIRRGFKVAYGLDELPDADELSQAGDCWKPYRTVASWYLWRAADRQFRNSG